MLPGPGAEVGRQVPGKPRPGGMEESMEEEEMLTYEAMMDDQNHNNWEAAAAPAAAAAALVVHPGSWPRTPGGTAAGCARGLHGQEGS